MKCPNCESITDNYSIENIIINYCKECWNYIGYEDKVCENHNPVYVKFTHQNNSIHIRKQCMSCGKIDSKYYQKESLNNWEAFPMADLSHRKLNENIDYTKIQEVFKRYDTKSKEVNKNVNFNKFLEEHTQYLKTEDWKKRRTLVLKRDNYLCQSCLENKATEVHHKSYRYWKNEPLFELISVCNNCHEIITNMNRDIVNFKKLLKTD